MLFFVFFSDIFYNIIFVCYYSNFFFFCLCYVGLLQLFVIIVFFGFCCGFLMFFGRFDILFRWSEWSWELGH